jgi:hypothetical protein
MTPNNRATLHKLILLIEQMREHGKKPTEAMAPSEEVFREITPDLEIVSFLMANHAQAYEVFEQLELKINPMMPPCRVGIGKYVDL